MEEKETLKEKWNKVDKKLLVAFVAGGIFGSIIAKSRLSHEVKMAEVEGYNRGTRDILKTIIESTQQ